MDGVQAELVGRPGIRLEQERAMARDPVSQECASRPEIRQIDSVGVEVLTGIHGEVLRCVKHVQISSGRGDSRASRTTHPRSLRELRRASRTTELPNSRTTELPNSRTPELPNSRTTELPNYRTTDLRVTRAA